MWKLLVKSPRSFGLTMLLVMLTQLGLACFKAPVSANQTLNSDVVGLATSNSDTLLNNSTAFNQFTPNLEGITFITGLFS